MIYGDTITAIATARGRGGIAVVRVSGPDAFEVAEKVAGIKPPHGKNSVSVASFRDISEGGKTVDNGVVLSFSAPRSYTGEDVVEFQCHGGEVAPARVLSACLAAGARLADRGEFTRRAFLNGRMGFDEAAAVLNLIDAKTARAADAALAGLSGERTKKCRRLYERALEISVELEHALDIDEGELQEDFSVRQLQAVNGFRRSLKNAVAAEAEGRILRDGALVVLSGPPNVGKSSLMNALLESDRAIVSEVPGTTRDSIEEWLDISGWPVRLVDTAGIRETDDKIEAQGVKRSRDLIARADIVISMFEAGSDMPPPVSGETITLATKCDLQPGACPRGAIAVSSLTGEGLAQLKSEISKTLSRIASAGGLGRDDDEILPLAGLSEAKALLDERVEGMAGEEIDIVLLADAMRLTASKIGEMIGAVYSDDMLDGLFNRFCVGK